MSKKPYNGYESWTAWNVCLWLHNDAHWHTIMQGALSVTPTKDDAAKVIFRTFMNIGRTHTPDGARFSLHNIRLALRA
jgi:hypothetical protein